jgi:hypothetical protein
MRTSGRELDIAKRFGFNLNLSGQHWIRMILGR